MAYRKIAPRTKALFLRYCQRIRKRKDLGPYCVSGLIESRAKKLGICKRTAWTWVSSLRSIAVDNA